MSLDEPSSGLPVLEHVYLDAAIDPQTVAFCDAHDLIAVINLGEDLENAITVYRLKGQPAFTIALRDDEDLRPLSLRWKPDGSLLAVNWSDEVCCLYSGENGKLLYELPTRPSAGGDEASCSLDINRQDAPGNGMEDDAEGDGSGSRLAPMTWTSYDSGGKSNHSRGQNEEDLTTEDFMSMMNGDMANGSNTKQDRSDSGISDLVNAITTLDTTTVLPRLSKIDPPSGMRHSPESNKFSTQASTDTIFDASTFAPGIFSTLLASDAKGCVTVFMDETIKVGHLQLPATQQIQSASDPHCPTQVILSRNQENTAQLTLNFIDLPLDKLGSPLNYVVSLNTRRLQSLTSYITHTIRCIHQEIQTGIKTVPARLMKLLEEDLQSAAGDSTSPSTTTTPNIATLELQHLALISSFHPVLLEWLKDIVKETGHKRWDQTTNSMYDHIASYLFKNLLPALHRYVAAVSALRGQARYHQHTGDFAVPIERLDALLEQADTLSLVAQKTLQVVTAEHAQFRAFSKWLRTMIDIAVAGPGTKSADETEEREAPNVDMDLCLRYIRGPLVDSKLKIFAESNPVVNVGMMDREAFFECEIVQAMVRERTVAALGKVDEAGGEGLQARGKGDEGAMEVDNINLPLLACLLRAHTRVAIESVNQWQAQAVPHSPDTIELYSVPSRGEVYDLAVYPPQPGHEAEEEGEEETVHILFSPDAEDEEQHLRLLSVQRRRRPKGQHVEPTVDESTLPITNTEGGRRMGQEGGKLTLHHAVLTSPTSAFALISDDNNGEGTRYHLLHLTLPPPTPSSPPTQPRILHTFPPNTLTARRPTHFLLGGRAGKKVAVIFFSYSASASASKGKDKGTMAKGWEVLDLEAVAPPHTTAGPARGGRQDADVEML